MPKNNSIVLKTHHSAVFKLANVQKIVCTADAENISKLLDTVSLAANPRESKKNKVTAAIIDTLSTDPLEMVNRTKGLLISTQKCEALERGRFRLTFEDEKTDGVLDGGHNLLAIGTFLLEKFHEVYDDAPDEILKIKNWEEFSNAWKTYRSDEKYYDELNNVIKDQHFLIPLEIIYPSDEVGPDFVELVFEISDARNNNSPLTAGTKADHRGYYDSLKAHIDPNIVDSITWKDNVTGKEEDGVNKHIKREDIVALALIPFIALQRKGLLDASIPNINPSIIYNSKAKCIEIYSTIIEHYKEKLPKVIENALSLMKDIPRYYDLAYNKFPDAYNSYSPGFGRILAVKKVNDGGKKAKTKFYQWDSDYKYPDGFILPFICSLAELIQIEDNGNVRWSTNIERLIDKDSMYQMLIGTIKDNHYDPVKVGKSSAAYAGCELSLKMEMMKA